MPIIDAISRAGLALTRYRVPILAVILAISVTLVSYFLVAATLALSNSKLGLIVIPTGRLGDRLLDVTALTVLAPGLTITAMIAFYAVVSVRRRHQLERLAEELGIASKDLGFSNTLLTAATETSPDGILAVGRDRTAVLVNRPFRELMKVPPDVKGLHDDQRLFQWIKTQVRDEAQFVRKIADLYADPGVMNHDQLVLKDGRILERYTKPLLAADDSTLGRIWFFREITAQVQAEQAKEYRANLAHGLAVAAGKLLGEPDLRVGVPQALADVAQALGADQAVVIEEAAANGTELPFVFRFSWNSPGVVVALDEAFIRSCADIMPQLGQVFAPLRQGKAVNLSRSSPGGGRALLERLQIGSFAVMPIMIDGHYWGQLGFNAVPEREWRTSEIDILSTLADLVGASIARARYVDELATADTIVEHSPVILYRLGAKPPFPMTYVSRNVEQLGYSAAEFLQSPRQFMKIFDAEDFTAVADHLNELSQRWETRAPSLWHLRKADGTHRWYENQLLPIFDDAGTLVSIEGIAIDTDERVNAEAELRRYNTLLDAVTHSVATLLTESSVAEAVPIALAHIGKATDEYRILVLQRPDELDPHPYPHLRFQWSKTSEPIRTFDQIIGPDAAKNFMKSLAPLAEGNAIVVTPETAQADLKKVMRATGATSFLWVPIFVDAAWWGHVSIEGRGERRIWKEAEIALFRTLANLIGAAIARDARTQALADASSIVENSSTILFRGLPQEPMPLVYISQNLRRYGYEAADFLRSPLLYIDHVHADDRAQLAEAQSRAASDAAQAGTVEFRFQTADGDYRWIENRYNPIRDPSGCLTEIEGILVDITERKKDEETIATLARTDALTGLANRRTFLERLDQAVAATKRGATLFAVLSLDLDHFKEINDTLGHPMGDLALQAIAQRLRKIIRETDLVARFGGDEFLILQSDTDDPAAAGALAEKIRAAVAVPIVIEGNTLQMTASIGISTFSPGIAGGAGMIVQADVALYRAKEEGRNRYRFHSDEMNTDVRDRMAIVADLHGSLARHEFELHYQPLVELASGKIVGMEALVRWNHPRRGRLLPAAFLPAAERAGLMVPLGRWVVNEACRQLHEWHADGIAPQQLTINLSPSQLKSGDQLIPEIAKALAKYRIAPGNLEFDVQERTLATMTPAQSNTMDALCKLGVRIAIDDFGSELSSLGYVQKFHVAHLKIGHNIVQTAANDASRRAAVKAIVDFAADLGVGVVVEGVETKDQRATLLSIEPHATAQGFFFSKPLEAHAATAALRAEVARIEHETQLEMLAGPGM